ncbi:MAG: Zn-ribbon domain-containing OB-fold protein [Caldilineae bacterium]|nr:MAG: Zn-ribbon domain-containing OB-fold protein [Caldilineae bacterium]
MSPHSFTHAEYLAHLQNHVLAASRCQNCGELYLPPRPLCRRCFAQDMRWEELSGRGELVAFTVVHIVPSAMLEAGYDQDRPYVSGLVRLEEGPTISALITGVDAHHPETIRVGSQVRVVFPRGDQDPGPAPLVFEVVSES